MSSAVKGTGESRDEVRGDAWANSHRSQSWSETAAALCLYLDLCLCLREHQLCVRWNLEQGRRQTGLESRSRSRATCPTIHVWTRLSAEL